MNSYSFWLNTSLSRSRVYAKRSIYERVLNELGRSIEKSATEIEDSQRLSPEQRDQIIDDEVEVVEYLLGTAFVLCQAYIVNVVSTVKRFHEVAKAQSFVLHTSTDNKENILQFGHKEDGFFPAELIDAFANYFKHRDEWRSVDWEKLDRRQKRTISIIKSVGAEPGSNGNLRQGSRVLGNTEFIDMVIFLDKLECWHIGLIDAYRIEFNQVFQKKNED